MAMSTFYPLAKESKAGDMFILHTAISSNCNEMFQWTHLIVWCVCKALSKEVSTL